MAVRKRKVSTEKKVEKVEKSTVEKPAETTKQQKQWKKEYLENQKELLDLYEEDDKIMTGDYIAPEDDERGEDRLLAQACLILNISSLIGNLIASILSGSLSILSTFIDSSMDISCSLVMNLCLRLINQSDTINYPRGRERLELIGVITCSSLMGFANMGMIVQSFNSIAHDEVSPSMTLPTVLIIVVQTVLKAILSWMCYKRASTSSMVIAMDLRNDLVTRILALVCGYAGDKYWRLADPIGAIAVCAWIAFSWFSHVMENMPKLFGKRAERENLSRILKITMEHDHRIKKIDHAMVYHTGEQALVELHIVMDESLPLKGELGEEAKKHDKVEPKAVFVEKWSQTVTHDISHPLEKKLQRLPFVERAFVHCDYFCDGD